MSNQGAVQALSAVDRRCELPMLIEPHTRGESLMSAFTRMQADFEPMLCEAGNVLMRGFGVEGVAAFREFAAAFGHRLLSYEFASTPRSSTAAGGVYTSTEYPAHQHIPLHSEQSYTREWPMKIWFHCMTAAAVGGATPLADNRKIYSRMPVSIRRRFEPGILYVRNFGAFDLPWQKVFNTRSRSDVEDFCRRASIDWEWKHDGELRTFQLCQGVETHPRTAQKVWFNQAHLFHISSLQAEVRESLVDTLGLDNVPRNVFFADGSVIPDSILADIRGVLQEHSVVFPWHAGDVLMLDNMLVSHARTPFEGPRKVVVAMAQAHGNLSRKTFESPVAADSIAPESQA